MNATDVLQRFGELRFPLEVELGSLTLTLGELFEMKTGAILTTDHATRTPFPVRVAGLHLAEAEPVVVDDRLSVRIKRLTTEAKPRRESNGTS